MKSIKTTFSVFLLLAGLCLGGCTLFESAPKTVVRKYLSSAKAFDIKAMDALMSDRLINQVGREKIDDDNYRFANGAAGGDHKMEVISETVSGDSAKLVFFYRDKAKNDSVKLGFKLVRQNGDWKIDSYGFGDPDEAAATPAPNSTPLMPDDAIFASPEPEQSKTPVKKK